MDAARRTLIAALLKGAVSALAARYWVETAFADSATPTSSLPDVEADDQPSFDMFLALSRLVTVRTDLDESLARRMYPYFLDEPWGGHHIASTYAQLRAVLTTADASVADRAVLGKGQAWFADHLLTTWYLGIYYHQRMAPVRLAYGDALMFDAVHRVLPARFSEATGFPGWATGPGRERT